MTPLTFPCQGKEGNKSKHLDHRVLTLWQVKLRMGVTLRQRPQGIPRHFSEVRGILKVLDKYRALFSVDFRL